MPSDDFLIKVNIHIPANLQGVGSLCAVVSATAATLCSDVLFIQQLELAVAEAANNIVKHGYKQKINCHICAEVYAKPSSVRVSLRDQAPLFNPLEGLSDETPCFDILDATEHSMGIGRYCMRDAMDKLEYRPLSNGNQLIMYKYVPDKYMTERGRV